MLGTRESGSHKSDGTDRHKPKNCEGHHETANDSSCTCLNIVWVDLLCAHDKCGKGRWKWHYGSIQSALVILFTLNSNHFKVVKHSEVSFLIWFFSIFPLFYRLPIFWVFIPMEEYFLRFHFTFFLLEKLRNRIWNI